MRHEDVGGIPEALTTEEAVIRHRSDESAGHGESKLQLLRTYLITGAGSGYGCGWVNNGAGLSAEFVATAICAAVDWQVCSISE